MKKIQTGIVLYFRIFLRKVLYVKLYIMSCDQIKYVCITIVGQNNQFPYY